VRYSDALDFSFICRQFYSDCLTARITRRGA
jgi:hypothetical protein